MAVTRGLYQTAHLTIVVAYTLFCAAVLGIEHPIYRFLASLGAALPIIWAVWVLSYARVPAETMEERLREEMRHFPTAPRYRRLSAELVALSKDARELDRVARELESGTVSEQDGFQRLNRIEFQMKRRVETMRALARP